jgi:hypothetical protein
MTGDNPGVARAARVAIEEAARRETPSDGDLRHFEVPGSSARPTAI